MKKARLSKNDVNDLLLEYRSKKKKYEFYLDETDTAIKKLEKALGTAVDEDKKPARRGRKPKTVKAAPKKRGRKAKRGRPKLVKAKRGRPRVVKAKRGRPKLAAKPAKITVPEKRGRKPTKKTVRKFTLSAWDNFLIKTLNDKNLALIKSEFVEAAKLSSDLGTSSMNPSQVELKITQSLHKLSNKKGLLIKVKYIGKGYAYALKEWITRKGDLMTVYRR